MTNEIISMPNTGNNVFFKLSEEFGYQNSPQKTSKDFSPKIIARSLIGMVAMRFFSNIGIYYNIFLGFAKGCLGLLSLKKQENIAEFTPFQYGQEFKRHIACMIYDLAILHFANYFILFYAAMPNEMCEFGKRIHNLILASYPLKVVDIL